MNKTTCMELVDGIRVVLPDDIQRLTSYVVAEQKDWFEDEIKFLRKCLQPGDRVIDVGASYGLYSLSAAKAVGPTGRVWSFEPFSDAADLLSASMIINGFSHLHLDRRALGEHPGESALALHDTPECNALIQPGTVMGRSQPVQVTTLDECLVQYEWRDIDLVKFDAEGSEEQIVAGGERFFRELSPLIQFELKDRLKTNVQLAELFLKMEFAIYRLVPGLNLLAPVNLQDQGRQDVLNLFACRIDRARRLAERGLLVLEESLTHETYDRVRQKALDTDGYQWRRWLLKLPYGTRMEKEWKRITKSESCDEVNLGLALYAMSQDANLSVVDRYVAMHQAVRVFGKLCETRPKHLRLASLARVASEFGERRIAVESLATIHNQFSRDRRVDVLEPFLSPTPRFDKLPPVDAVGSWFIASLCEAFEKLGYFSSFYSRESSVSRLQTIADLGYANEELQRRWGLVQRLIQQVAAVSKPAHS